jgi:hypothetical protein
MTKKKIRIPAFAGMTMLLLSTNAHAGAWLMPEGEGLAITQLTTFGSHEYWDANGNLQPQFSYRKYEIQPYAEYGLTKKVTIGGTAYLQRDRQAGGTNTGIADPEFFARVKLWNTDYQVLSLQPLLKLPGYFQHNDALPRGGSKSTDAELSLLYGYSLNIVSARDYIDARIGYRARNQGLNGQYKADLAVGLMPLEKWQFIPAIRYIKAQSIDSATAFTQTGDLDYDLLKAELTVAYHLDSGNWLQATYFQHLDGKQTGSGEGMSLGYAVRF